MSAKNTMNGAIPRHHTLCIIAVRTLVNRENDIKSLLIIC